MSTSTHRRPAHAARAATALAVLLWLPLQAFNGWTQATPAEPSQKPLITRDGGQPNPNVMVTLDTSWSMIFPYVPEGPFQVNGYAVKFPSFKSPIMHPDDPRHDPGSGAAAGDGGAIPADLSDTSNVFQRQMRSPDVNRLYYDPRLQYKAWLLTKNVSTGAETRAPNVDPAKAWFDPNKTSATDKYADLTATASASTAISKNSAGNDIYWCENNPTSADGAGSLNCTAKAKKFSPAVYFLLRSGANPTEVASYDVYDINDTNTTTRKAFTKYAARTDCTTQATTCTQAEELQNYANWFVYYRTRLHVAQAAIPESFLQLSNSIRVGWGTIHQGASSVDGSNTSIVQSGVRDLTTARKSELATWIRNFRSDEEMNDNTPQPRLKGGTPLLSALTGVGEYFKRTDSRNPWVTDPSRDGTASLSCRRAYNLLITDGYYNDSSLVSDEDGTAGSEITERQADGSILRYTYEPAAPFIDSMSSTGVKKSGTLADVAMKYWKNDLQINMANKVPSGNDTPLEDPAFWQHVVQFPIGLGVSGNIPINDLNSQFNLFRTGKGWWDGNSTVAPSDPRRIDDLLHAAINSRGQYFSARNAAELTDALTTALNRAAEQKDLKEAGVATASLVLSANNTKYVPEYTTTSWTGNIKAYILDENGVVVDADANAPGVNPRWIASEKLPSAANRNIVTWTGAAGINFNDQTFNAGSVLAAMLTPTLPAGATAQELVNYIRGDTSNEDTFGAANKFRKRNGRLPDFINSNPVVIKGNVNLGYDKLPTTTAPQDSYTTFLRTKAARNPVLFIGGNGGMLHAFADYTAEGVVPGQEIFAYIPRAVLPKLGTLAQRTYGREGNYHRYYVDGPLVETDAYITPTPTSPSTVKSWKNMLIGTLGAGGKGIFALDVTDPSALDTSSVRWEKTDGNDTTTTAPVSDIGYMFGAPQVGVLPSGDWAVFVGNGIHSASGKAVMLVINLSSGVMSKLVVDDGTGNGLGAVTLVKDSDQQVIGAYAGDLKGQVWRFNVNSSTTVNGTTTSSLSATLLYKATDGTRAQPITAAPGLAPHPKGGYLVMVGTGKLLDTGDNDNLNRQTLYGLWDKNATIGGESLFNTASTTPRSKLIQQTINSAETTTGGIYYSMSANAVNYGDDVLGWYIDLTIEDGQRMIYPPMFIQDYFIISTMAPARAAAFCDAAKGNGYNFVIPALTGGQSTDRVLDTNRDHRVTDADRLVSVYTTNADGGDQNLIGPNSDPDSVVVSSQNTTGEQYIKLPKKKSRTIKSRTWRQILSPPRPL